MDPSLILHVPPPLDPEWLLHESQQPPPLISPPDALTHRSNYTTSCRERNARCLSTTHSRLVDNISSVDTLLPENLEYRTYTPLPVPVGSTQNQDTPSSRPAVIYYHGGGLYVGDLDSEDLSCRLICKELQCVVYSCNYRLMPEHTADDALSDAISLFNHLLLEKPGPFILVGSSSGGQLAAQVSQYWLQNHSQEGNGNTKLLGVLLRCPVTCNAYALPPQFKSTHTSFTPAFYTSLIANTCVDSEHRTTTKLPLEEEQLKGLPKHWIQVCSNDLFYSDGVCYAGALRGNGVEVVVRSEVGWPHTFWLKAPGLGGSEVAEGEMIGGLRWLMEDE